MSSGRLQHAARPACVCPLAPAWLTPALSVRTAVLTSFRTSINGVMAWQTSLLRGFAKKNRFFSATVDSSQDGYYAVVEALWSLDHGSKSRQEFLNDAQNSWKERYSHYAEARTELYRKSAEARKGGPSSFVKRCNAEQSTTVISFNAPSTSLSQREAVSSGSIRRPSNSGQKW